MKKIILGLFILIICITVIGGIYSYLEWKKSYLPLRDQYQETALQLEKLYQERMEVFKSLLSALKIDSDGISAYLSFPLNEIFVSQTHLDHFENLQTQINTYFGKIIGELVMSKTPPSENVRGLIKQVERIEFNILKERKNYQTLAQQLNSSAGIWSSLNHFQPAPLLKAEMIMEEGQKP